MAHFYGESGNATCDSNVILKLQSSIDLPQHQTQSCRCVAQQTRCELKADVLNLVYKKLQET